ncbi:MAG TPA: hypothetical protein VEJ36_03725 [Nitrososphaerales archaeon]|nr:hypothetical protein [Nitrososphaerales archaeon]
MLRCSVTRRQADRIATEIMAQDVSIRAVMVLNNQGEVLAHIRDEAPDDEEGITQGLPSLITLPGVAASVFLRFAPLRARLDYARK